MSEEDQLHRLDEVMRRLRRECPWDAKQTHRSLVSHLIEETAEVVDAIETADDTDLTEELGDLLLQVYFHAEIARTQGRFDLQDVAKTVADKLIRRHPHVFDEAAAPKDEADMWRTWESLKKEEKQRSSSLSGIANRLDSLARLYKIILRARSHEVEIDLPDEPITANEFAHGLTTLVARAQASGLDPDQVARDAIRVLENRIYAAEAEAAE